MPLTIKIVARMAFVCVVVFGTRLSAAGVIVGEAEVVDGDGLMIGPAPLRIHGIDSPEPGQKCALPGGDTWGCAEAAADRLAELTDGRDVKCELLDTDPYNRIISRCTADGVDVGAVLVEEDLAWAFIRYSADYVELEAAARAAGRGIWRADTLPAWDYRADRWGRAVQDSPGGCPIKGNVSSEGDRIYHTPWSPSYAQTEIKEAAGEKWFCDEAEAIAAGWRAARSR